MPRYFFDVKADGEKSLDKDEEGIDLPSPDHARSEAAKTALNILAERWADSPVEFNVRNEAGRTLYFVRATIEIKAVD